MRGPRDKKEKEMENTSISQTSQLDLGIIPEAFWNTD